MLKEAYALADKEEIKKQLEIIAPDIIMHCSSPIGNKNPYILQINGGTDMDYYRNLLLSVSTDMKSQEYMPYKSRSDYNIFHILEVTEKEVVMCRFLTDLLNPEGQHGCGILFLKSFFNDVLNINRIKDTLLAHTDIIKEFAIDNERRIDIVIYNTHFFIPMEVKIYAGEQKGQCYDYFEYAKKFDENTQIIYLTRFGNEPTEYSRKAKNGTEILSNDKIKCISWETDICEWLTALLIQLNEPIKSLVVQYIDAIHFIANRKDDRIMEKNLEVLYESADFFSAGIQIEKTMKAAKLKLIRLVFDDFKEEMDMAASKYGLELEKDAIYYSYDEKQHEKFYDCYSTYPGLNYVVKKATFQKSSLQMWFRIEVEHNLFAGISLFDTEAIPKDGNSKGYQVNDITTEIIDEAAHYLNRDIITPSNWWLAWCYPNGKRQDDYYDDVPDFKHMNQCAINLVDNQKRTEFVKNAVMVFEEQLLKYLL